MWRGLVEAIRFRNFGMSIWDSARCDTISTHPNKCKALPLQWMFSLPPRARMCCAHAWCYVIASEFLENWEQAVVLLELQCCNTNRRLRLFWCSRPGGFASVWLCNDTRRDKNKLVALKVPLPQSFCHFLAHLLSIGLNTRLMQHFCVDAKRIASEVQSSRPLPKICARGGVKLSFCPSEMYLIYIYIYIWLYLYLYPYGVFLRSSWSWMWLASEQKVEMLEVVAEGRGCQRLPELYGLHGIELNRRVKSMAMPRFLAVLVHVLSCFGRPWSWPSLVFEAICTPRPAMSTCLRCDGSHGPVGLLSCRVPWLTHQYVTDGKTNDFGCF